MHCSERLLSGDPVAKLPSLLLPASCTLLSLFTNCKCTPRGWRSGSAIENAHCCKFDSQCPHQVYLAPFSGLCQRPPTQTHVHINKLLKIENTHMWLLIKCVLQFSFDMITMQLRKYVSSTHYARCTQTPWISGERARQRIGSSWWFLAQTDSLFYMRPYWEVGAGEEGFKASLKNRQMLKYSDFF